MYIVVLGFYAATDEIIANDLYMIFTGSLLCFCEFTGEFIYI